MTALLTPAEYRASPTAVDTNNLVAAGNQAAQDAALAEEIRRATGWVATQINFDPIASSAVSLHYTRFQRDGTLSIPAYRVPNQLVSISIGTNLNNLTALADISGAFLDEWNWVIPTSNGAPFVGAPYQFGFSRSGKVLVKLTQIGGWANTTVNAIATAGQSALTVASGVGFTPALGSDPSNEQFIIFDGANTEVITVVSVAGNVLTLGAPLASNHAVGVAVSGIPAAMKEASVLATSAFIRNRSSEAILASQSLQPGPSSGDMANRGPAFAMAARMLTTFARVR